jgi:hypothetical protein
VLVGVLAVIVYESKESKASLNGRFVSCIVPCVLK